MKPTAQHAPPCLGIQLADLPRGSSERGAHRLARAHNAVDDAVLDGLLGREVAVAAHVLAHLGLLLACREHRALRHAHAPGRQSVPATSFCLLILNLKYIQAREHVKRIETASSGAACSLWTDTSVRVRQGRADAAREQLDISARAVLQLVGLDHDVGRRAKRAVEARRRGHDARVRQRKAAALLARRQDQGRVAERLQAQRQTRISGRLCPRPLASHVQCNAAAVMRCGVALGQRRMNVQGRTSPATCNYGVQKLQRVHAGQAMQVSTSHAAQR